jgi:hypothetical protein
LADIWPKTKTKEAAVGYRTLKTGEEIKIGDEFLIEEGRWEPSMMYKTRAVVGGLGTAKEYRRPIKAKTAKRSANKPKVSSRRRKS